MLNAAVNSAMEGHKRAQQEYDRIVQRWSGSDPSSSLINPVVDLELLPNDKGFLIIRRLNNEMDRQERDMQRPSMTPSDSRDFEWSLLVGEIKANLGAINAQFVVENTFVKVISKPLAALVSLWNRGEKFKTLLSQRRVIDIREALAIAHNAASAAQRSQAELPYKQENKATSPRDILIEKLERMREDYRFQYNESWEQIEKLQPKINELKPGLMLRINSLDQGTTVSIATPAVENDIPYSSDNEIYTYFTNLSDLIVSWKKIDNELALFIKNELSKRYNQQEVLFKHKFKVLTRHFSDVQVDIFKINKDLYDAVTQYIESTRPFYNTEIARSSTDALLIYYDVFTNKANQAMELDLELSKAAPLAPSLQTVISGNATINFSSFFRSIRINNDIISNTNSGNPERQDYPSTQPFNTPRNL